MRRVFSLDPWAPKPLLFYPEGDNKDLLEELRRRWAGETLVKVGRPESGGPVSVVDLLSAAERETVQATPTAAGALEKKIQATLKGMRSPKYKEAVLTWMLESYSEHGLSQKTPVLWSHLSSRSQFEVPRPDGVYVLTLEPGTNTLFVNKPGGGHKELAYSTFENYATELKKRVRTQNHKS